MSSTMVPKALIFDCDGTLADTMPLHWRAWQVVAKRYQLHFPEDVSTRWAGCHPGTF